MHRISHQIRVKAATLLGVAVLSLAASETSSAQVDSRFKPVANNTLQVASLGIPVQDIQTGELSISKKADAEQTASWRKHAIRSLWREMQPAEDPLSEPQLNQILAGRFVDLPPDFTFSVSPILDGTPLVALSPFGMVLKGSASNGPFEPICSGILTKPTIVLTARHCVDDLEAGESLKVYFPYEGIRDVVENGISLVCKTGDPGCVEAIDDLAAITLSEEYTLLPTARPGQPKSVIDGASAEILGFGMSDRSQSDNGILRTGDIVLDACTRCPGNASFIDRSLCFDFSLTDASTRGVNVHANLSADSGGPMLAQIMQAHSVIGVASRYDRKCNLPNERESKYVNITHDDYQGWLSSVFCSPSCANNSGDLIDSLIDMVLKQSTIDSLDPYLIEVKPMTKRLIFTLNHEVLGLSPDRADVELKMPPSLNATCQRHFGAEACIAESPSEGTHQVHVKHMNREPNYQLTALAVRCADDVCWNEFQSKPATPLSPQDLSP